MIVDIWTININQDEMIDTLIATSLMSNKAGDWYSKHECVFPPLLSRDG